MYAQELRAAQGLADTDVKMIVDDNHSQLGAEDKSIDDEKIILEVKVKNMIEDWTTQDDAVRDNPNVKVVTSVRHLTGLPPLRDEDNVSPDEAIVPENPTSAENEKEEAP